MIHRLLTLARRSIRATAFGVRFTGTRHFRLPPALRLRSQWVKVSTPDEPGPSWDFIDLALDDDYGLRELADPPMTVLDVGANCGLFSLLAAHYFPAAEIHAYEPNPRIFPYAEGNLSALGIKTFQAGVGSRSGTADLADDRESRLAQTILTEDGTISMVSLSEAVSRLGGKVDLLKLDCEGAEWDIFQAKEAFRQIRSIRMEYHLSPDHGLNELLTLSGDLGFRLDRLVEHGSYGVAWFSKH